MIFCFPLVVIFSQCFYPEKFNDPRGEKYTGARSCEKCHQKIYDLYLANAHYTTTRPGDEASIHGFTGSDTFKFNNKLGVAVEKQNNALYQVSYINGKATESRSFDIVFGGRKAETYLYWKGNQLYQLPLSYFIGLHAWANSPGYTNDKIDFNRLIGKRCLECHSSYIKELPNISQSISPQIAFDKSSLIMGIDCERCHGAGADHVNFHSRYAGRKQGEFISAYKALTRLQKVDMCAVCHSGNSSSMARSTFEFTPGAAFSTFKDPSFYHKKIDSASLDVHGNQTQMLQSSKCYIRSNMDCTTCHDPHAQQTQSLAIYTQKCLACHRNAETELHKKVNITATTIINRCINCHLPLRPSKTITVQTMRKKNDVPYFARSHHIAVY